MSTSDFGGLCPNGHDLPMSAAYCPTCGAPAYEHAPPPPTNVWSAPKAPLPPPPPPPPVAWQQPYYAVPGPGYPPPLSPWAIRRPLNTLAVVSVVAAILWVFWLGALVAIIVGHTALGQINRTGERGKGLAITGLALGYSEILLFLFSLVALRLL